jgi:hypothetical protein
LPDIAAHHQDRFAQDCQLDNADLRRIIKAAMDTNSDEQLIEVYLKIGAEFNLVMLSAVNPDSPSARTRNA